MSDEAELAPIEPKTKRERELRDRAVRDYAADVAAGRFPGPRETAD